MEQTTLFHDDIYAALDADIQALGGRKKVGHSLWPHKEPDEASEQLRNCLRSDRREKLDPEQVMLIKLWAREVNSFATITFESQRLAYQFSLIQPEDEAESIQLKIDDSVKQLERLLDRYSSLRLPAVRGTTS